MKLYNTLTRQIKLLKPQNPPDVTAYTCGPTVYYYPHIGNWFTFIRYDLVVRTLQTSGLKVKLVMNITDVGHLESDADQGDDKMELAALREAKSSPDRLCAMGERARKAAESKYTIARVLLVYKNLIEDLRSE